LRSDNGQRQVVNHLQVCFTRGWLIELMETLQNSIQMRTAVRESLLNRLLDESRRVVFM
jgi:hypothetical protein